MMNIAQSSFHFGNHVLKKSIFKPKTDVNMINHERTLTNNSLFIKFKHPNTVDLPKK